MSIRYFSNFPIMTYSLDSTTNDVADLRTNIFRRVNFREYVAQNAQLFYPYTIKESDLPEIIADKLYGSVDYYWVVTLFNNILDPVLDWPKPYNNFQSYIIQQYGSIAVAKNQVHHYTKTVSKTNSSGTSAETFIIDLDTYNALTSVVPESYSFPDGSSVSVSTTRAIVSSYEYEESINESKRAIKLLKPDYLPQVRAELAKLSV